MQARNLSNDSVWRDLLLNYFERISRLHFEFMWSHLDRTQMLASPFGAHLLDVLSFRSDMGQFAEMVTVYLGFSRIEAGYIVPEQGTREINQPGPDSEAYRRFSNHRDTYRLSEVGDSELGRTIFACAGFCQRTAYMPACGRRRMSRRTD